MNELGEVRWHSLTEGREIEVYDVYWPKRGVVQRGIPASMLEAAGQKTHEHAARDKSDLKRG